MFKNDHLHDPAFHADQLLLNAVTYLTHGADMTRIQSRRRPPSGFGFLTPATKLAWRVFAVGLAPTLLALLGLLRLLGRGRPRITT